MEVRDGCMEEPGALIDGKAGTRSRGRQGGTVRIRDLGARRSMGALLPVDLGRG